MCEWCPGDGDESRCVVCNISRQRDRLDYEENQDDDNYRLRQRRYSQAVSAVCLVVLVVITLVAGTCALVNTFGKH